MEEDLPNRERHSMIEYDAIMSRLGGDHELLNEFIEIFIEDSPEHLKKFVAGLKNEDAGQVRHAVHSLKGLASNFGAVQFCRAAQSIESSAAEGSLDQCREQQNGFSDLLNELTKELVSQLER